MIGARGGEERLVLQAWAGDWRWPRGCPLLGHIGLSRRPIDELSCPTSRSPTRQHRKG